MSESRIFTAYQQHNETLEQSLALNSDVLEQYAQSLSESFANGKRLIIVGSGRLAGVASTVANAFLFQMGEERPSLPVVALNQDAGLATTLAQSAAFEQYFSCQLQAQANADDCVLFLDCNASPAMVAALQAAGEIGCSTMVMTCGDEHAWKKENADLVIPMMAPSHASGVEAVLFFCQLLCRLVESELFGFE
ncbi:MAG: hypothetical protein BA874_07245 [Desulfuromonadales bacterium C00003068]|nr:MAG: hypothetical protein BA874_07245 [Desulfuromonadales bacterium C00003068]